MSYIVFCVSSNQTGRKNTTGMNIYERKIQILKSFRIYWNLEFILLPTECQYLLSLLNKDLRMIYSFINEREMKKEHALR